MMTVPQSHTQPPSTETHPHSRAAATALLLLLLLLLRNNLNASQELQHHDPLYQPAHPDC
jgi:hypothetical protein